MHLKRLIVAAVLVPLLYLYTMYLSPQYYLLLITVVSTVALAEFYAISGVEGFLKYSGLFWGAALLVVQFFARELMAEALFIAVLAMLTLRLFLKRDAAGSVREATAAIFGLLYIPGLLSFQLDIIKAGAPLLVMLYAAVWGSDSMALYVGKSIGRRKLYVEMSPNKTVEGAVGSFIGGLIGVLLIKFTVLNAMPLSSAIILGLVVSFATILGDLVESMFKRDAGVKDSSSIVPGHGGFLDKIDSVTFAGPAFYWACLFLHVIR
ncbi:MAG: phosphatidate cytidylyltransferase [Nitrospirae bacterium]|nr:phosphatidate cytidylyltransferase [Nitrospirota bacterium]